MVEFCGQSPRYTLLYRKEMKDEIRKTRHHPFCE
nr:MAG TPA: hypothetical protein [Caudoviricetes sp.]